MTCSRSTTSGLSSKQPASLVHDQSVVLLSCPAEPVISGQIMELHHAKHHAAYVTNLNKALEQYAEAESKHDLQKMISLQSAINFNGGGMRGKS